MSNTHWALSLPSSSSFRTNTQRQQQTNSNMQLRSRVIPIECEKNESKNKIKSRLSVRSIIVSNQHVVRTHKKKYFNVISFIFMNHFDSF